MPHYIRNAQIEDTLRCVPQELAHLNKALRRQMQETTVDGQPVMGLLFSRDDADRSIREAMWQRIADSDPVFAAMLSGARWRSRPPHNFQQRLLRIKHELERRWNGPYRHDIKMGKIVVLPNPNNEPGAMNQPMSISSDDSKEGAAPSDDEEDNVDEDEVKFASHSTSSQADSIPPPTPSLSAKVRNAVKESVAGLEVRISELEDAASLRDASQNRSEIELEERLMRRMEAALAQRDAEIERLKTKLEAESVWRDL